MNVKNTKDLPVGECIEGRFRILSLELKDAYGNSRTDFSCYRSCWDLTILRVSQDVQKSLISSLSTRDVWVKYVNEEDLINFADRMMNQGGNNV